MLYSWAIYHIASGQAFFSGIVLIELAAVAAFWARSRWPTIGCAIIACAGLILIAVSSTPLPVWFYGVAGILTVAWIGVECSPGPRHWRYTPFLRSAVLAVWLCGLALEVPFHLAPTVPNLATSQLFLIGDSLSAGVGGNIETWPKLFARQHHVGVVDLSRSGADAADAMQQAEQITAPNLLVLAEIGGNDVLRGYPPERYERGLDALLAKLREGGRTVVMLELPLPPFCNRYGAAQRRLANRYGILLVPKRLLMRVLTTDGATLDSIHLTARGHALLAEAIWNSVGDAFGPRSERSRHQDRLER